MHYIQYIQENYLINRGKDKLVAIEYDRLFFKNAIIEGKEESTQTESQERIKNAKNFFIKKLVEKEDTKKILAIFEAMRESKILSIHFGNKKDSVLMFELQNNRGKDLTNMEKLKSYLSYQIYTYCTREEAESKLRDIAQEFGEIYRLKGDISESEDTILNGYNVSLFGFYYREHDDTLNYKKELCKKEGKERIKWIENYVRELKLAFSDYKDYEHSESPYEKFFGILEISQVYPFIIKAYRIFRNNDTNSKTQKLEEVFKALEIMAFRHRAIGTRAQLDSRLTKVLKNFKDVESLTKEIKEICTDQSAYWEGNNSYWGNEALKKSLYAEDDKYKDIRKIAQYILVRYENFLRNGNTHKKGYTFSLKDIKKPEIEHISPQKPSDGSKLKTGYDNYNTKQWKDGCYLNRLGNFLLIDKSHNGSIGNKPFKEKLESYKTSPLSHHQEVRQFTNGEKWDMETIKKRHEKLENFVLETWSFK